MNFDEAYGKEELIGAYDEGVLGTQVWKAQPTAFDIEKSNKPQHNRHESKLQFIEFYLR